MGGSACSFPTRDYDGHGDGLVTFYVDEYHRKVILTAQRMMVLAEDVRCTQNTIVAVHGKICRGYERNLSTIPFISKEAFNGCFMHSLEKLMIPYQPQQLACKNGCDGSHLVIDGIDLTLPKRGIEKRFSNQKFNFITNTKPYPRAVDGNLKLISISKKYEQFSFSQGQFQEKLIRCITAAQTTKLPFRRGYFIGPKGSLIVYTEEMYATLCNLLQDASRRHNKFRAISFIINSLNLWQPDNSQFLAMPKFLKVQQALLGTKNHLKFFTPKGIGLPSLIFGYIALSMGCDVNSTYIPTFLKSVWSMEELNCHEARFALAGTQVDVVDEEGTFVNYIEEKFSEIVGGGELNLIMRPQNFEASEAFCERLCK